MWLFENLAKNVSVYYEKIKDFTKYREKLLQNALLKYFSVFILKYKIQMYFKNVFQIHLFPVLPNSDDGQFFHLTHAYLLGDRIYLIRHRRVFG